MNRRIYRMPDMQYLFGGCSSATIRRLEKAGVIPKHFKINPYGRSIGWYSDEADSAASVLRQHQQVVPRDNTVIGRGKPGPGRGHRKQAQAA